MHVLRCLALLSLVTICFGEDSLIIGVDGSTTAMGPLRAESGLTVKAGGIGEPRVIWGQEGDSPFQTFLRWTGSDDIYAATRIMQGVGKLSVQVAPWTTIGAHAFVDSVVFTQNGETDFYGDVTVHEDLDVSGKLTVKNEIKGVATGAPGMRLDTDCHIVAQFIRAIEPVAGSYAMLQIAGGVDAKTIAGLYGVWLDGGITGALDFRCRSSDYWPNNTPLRIRDAYAAPINSGNVTIGGGSIGVGSDLNVAGKVMADSNLANDYVAKIRNTSGAGGAGLHIQTSDGNGVGDALRVDTFSGNAPQTMLRIPNYKSGESRVILAETAGSVVVGNDPLGNERFRVEGDAKLSGSLISKSIETTDINTSSLHTSGVVELGAMNDQAEGAEVVWMGAGSYPSWISDVSANAMRFFANAAGQNMEYRIFNNSGGYGGVVNLYVDGTIRSASGVRVESVNPAEVVLSQSGGKEFRIGSNSGELIFYDAETQVTRAKITSGGSFEIFGPLQVYGPVVHRNEVKWPDYVFDDDYELMPLADLERFVRQNRHLPAVPSEAEIVESGLDMSSMLTVHMTKIEELMLYAIQQNIRANDAESRVAALEARLRRIEAVLGMHEK